jgi:hypothetical protein
MQNKVFTLGNIRALRRRVILLTNLFYATELQILPQYTNCDIVTNGFSMFARINVRLREGETAWKQHVS